MKCLLSILLSCLALILSAQNVYYVQDTAYNANASDENAGTNITLPWATWQKAFDVADAGDTVFFRDGIWYPDSANKTGYPIVQHDPANAHGNNGEYGNPIVFINYPGETPILDCWYASESTTGNIGLSLDGPSHIVMKGLTIRNVRMRNPVHNCSGIEVTDAGNITLERMTVYGVGGVGYWLARYDTLNLINCDAYNICDSLDLTVPGGDGDGYNITSGGEVTDTFKIAYITGCRAWNCSDDGFDIGSTKQFIISNCWSFHNGIQYPESGADGNGFKLAGSEVYGVDKRMIHHSLSAFNQVENAAGFTAQNLVESNGPSCSFYNNTSYKDYMGFFTAIPIGWDCNTEPGFEIWRNNIVYGNIHYAWLVSACDSTERADQQVIWSNNSHTIQEGYEYPYSVLNEDFTITDDDFVLTDSTQAMSQLLASRQSDGSLPEITFMKLVEGSDLIDGGIDVGLPYSDAAPDLGYAEYSPPITVRQGTSKRIRQGSSIRITL